MQDYLLVKKADLTEDEAITCVPSVYIEAELNRWLSSVSTRRSCYELYEVVTGITALDDLLLYRRPLDQGQVKQCIAGAFRNGSLAALPLGPLRLQSSGGAGSGASRPPPAELPLLPEVPLPKPEAPHPQAPLPAEVPVTVKITAQDGKAAAPTTVAISNSIKLRGVPSKDGGTYKWSTSSARLTLQGAELQTVTVVAGKDPSPNALAEEVQLVFTPTGKEALAPVKHQLSVATAVFQKEASHPWGYDAHEKIRSRDKDNTDTEPTPGPQQDFISIKKQGVGKASVVLSGVEPASVFFKSTDESVCKPKSKQPSQTPFVLEIEAMAKDKSEAVIEARLESENGPVIAKLGVVVLKEVAYLAELFRVVDSSSAGTSLSLASSPADAKTALNDYYKQAVAGWDISGSTTEVDAAYDIIKNGKLDMEPGKVTDEQRKIIAACVSTRSRVIHVHSLRWCYYLVADAKATDTKLKLKNYGSAYLGYIGKKAYTLEDSKGQTASVTIMRVDTGTGEVELASPLGVDLTVADHAALIWPLGGLSGNPLWVGDKLSLSVLNNYIAHELGHEVAGLSDVCERNNLMHGGSDTGALLRHRPLSQYYSPRQNEEQWKRMKNR